MGTKTVIVYGLGDSKVRRMVNPDDDARATAYRPGGGEGVIVTTRFKTTQEQNFVLSLLGLTT